MGCSVSNGKSNFSNTTGSSPDFLHINTAIPTQIESGASVIPGFNNDFDNQPVSECRISFTKLFQRRQQHPISALMNSVILC
ncbi:MAG: hypothetical protein IPP52_14255 [Ignavibacteria bacterium]|nr:hypothetical protein [Ignavibacteria bacterium]